jgi:hypothetical protein
MILLFPFLILLSRFLCCSEPSVASPFCFISTPRLLLPSNPLIIYPFLNLHYSYCQRILTISLPILSFCLKNSSMSSLTLDLDDNILLFFLQDMHQSLYGRWIFVIEVHQGLLCILEVLTRLPRILLVSVILPLDEVLYTPSSLPCCKNFFYVIFRVPFLQYWTWGLGYGL